MWLGVSFASILEFIFLSIILGFLFLVFRKSWYTTCALCCGFMNSSQMSQQVISLTYWAISSADAPAYDPISRAVQFLSIL